MVDLIESQGGEVAEFPTIEIVPPASYEGLDRAIEEINSYHWLIFTSANGVRFFLKRLRDLNVELGQLRRIKIAVIGPETAKELQRNDLKIDVLPDEYRAEAILAGLSAEKMRGRRVLLPRAAKAREILPDTLRKWDAKVDVVEAYRAVPAADEASKLRAQLKAGRIDMVTFTSSSTVQAFVACFSPGELKECMSAVCVGCIGPITQKTAEQAGLQVDVVAREYTVAGLVQAFTDYFATRVRNPRSRSALQNSRLSK
jgi:uroporphyrinogen III methyltransferase/synthase